MEVVDGRVVALEYTVRLGNGELLDSTGRCGPVRVLIGAGQLLPALEARLTGLRSGETRTFRIPPDEAYGVWRAELVRAVPRDRLPPDLLLEQGSEYRLKSPDGSRLRFRVVDVGPGEVKADFNDPKAGQELVATVTVVEVREATPDEERRGRV